jgi:hypothetical protein
MRGTMPNQRPEYLGAQAVLLVIAAALLFLALLAAALASVGWTGRVFGSRLAVPTLPGMQDRDYWTRKLREAEAELEAAKKRSDVNAAASKLQRAKAELKALEEAARSKRRSSRGKAPAGASA